ncbi:deoxyribodipyrimidine photo-lyase [Ignavibacteria bacterium]|nr:deoxyribodipyrimidine photo-lyase [Bacteroidota bacterium]MCZ2132475.1 deoxyribodipyrimidine photo-lyase [Bacteroidota bacterium]
MAIPINPNLSAGHKRSINPKRIEKLHDGQAGGGAVVYWMSREQRTQDNWALLYAQSIAIELRTPLRAVFCLQNNLLGGTVRQYEFMFDGLREIEAEFAALNIGLTILLGKPENVLPPFLENIACSALVCDFDPLRTKLIWQYNISRAINIPIFRVDARNIVPYNIVSQEPEPDIFTFHRKIHNFLPEFLTNIPPTTRHPFGDLNNTKHNNWDFIRASLWRDSSVGTISGITAGPASAKRVLHTFIHERLNYYHTQYSDPNANIQSHLSPYLHFGQISAQRIALYILAADAPQNAKSRFLNNIIMRREFADNFCFYNPNYDLTDIFSERTLELLAKRRAGCRRYIYSLRDFEHAETHDKLWNATQIEMITTGFMQGYLRKYWVRKIFDWSISPDEAIQYAIYLNNKYQIGGRDSNSFASIVTSICEIHDLVRVNRLILKRTRVRTSVSYAEKFDMQRYIARFTL